ncbi:hypothetical protein JNUCC64_32145 [Streptomyces sp. JNUCC 64]
MSSERARIRPSDRWENSVEPVPSLPETLDRLESLIGERGLSRADLLDATDLAARTALPEDTVHALLKGGTPPEDTVNDRVRARIRTLTELNLHRTGRKLSELVAEISRRLGVSEYWARQVCDGKKVPSVEFLHGLVEFFGVEGGEAFFTAQADEALNRVLRPVLRTLEDPSADPVQALMDRYGVKSTDLRMCGFMTREQLERLLEGVLRSVLPEEPEGREARR